MQKILLLTIISFLLCINPLEAGVKQRIISIAPATTEILFALGLDQEIVAVSSTCDYPKEAQDKERIGVFSQPNIERILSLKPDIIFCTGLEQAPTVNKLKRLGLRVYVSDPSNIKELFGSISDIGKLTGRKEEAFKLIKEIESSVEEMRLKLKNISGPEKPKVFIEIWHNPLMTAGAGSFIDELLTLAGGVNIASDTKRPYSYFSPELVIKRNPDYIILAYMNKEQSNRTLRRRLGWVEISAVKNNRVYNDIDPDLLLRPGPRIIEGLKEIHAKLYPLR